MRGEKILTRVDHCWLEDDGIFRAVSLPRAYYRLDDARETIGVLARLSPGIRRPVCVDMRQMSGIDADARRYYAGEETGRVLSAIALLIGSPISRMVGNFFITLQRPTTPVRLFTDEAEALTWLRSFLPAEEAGA